MVTKEYISLTLSEMFLSVQITFSFVRDINNNNNNMIYIAPFTMWTRRIEEGKENKKLRKKV